MSDPAIGNFRPRSPGEFEVFNGEHWLPIDLDEVARLQVTLKLVRDIVNRHSDYRGNQHPAIAELQHLLGEQR